MKVLFISGVFEGFKEKIPQHTIVRCQPGIAYYWLRSFFETTKPHLKDKVTWARPLYYERRQQDYVDYVLEQKPDILCSTGYTWNIDLHYSICERVKELMPEIKIVIGGPEIQIRDIGKNFERFPVADALVYGDGEESLAELLEDYLKTGEIKSGVNRAINKDDIGYYKRFKYEDYPPYSFFAEYKKELLEDFADVKEKFGADMMQISTEYMRGCMYGCTFCDWNSGLHHKISKRSMDTVKQELLFLQETFGEDLGMYWCDANWGMGKHYNELTDYMINNKIATQLGSWTKLGKWKSFELWKNHVMNDDFLPRRNMSMQSPKAETLKAINRPEEFTWEEQLEYLQAHEDFIISANEDPNRTFKLDRYLYYEFILDLPLMTLEDYKKIFRDMNRFTVGRINFYNWQFLPNSPAAEPGYLEKYGLKLVDYLGFEEVFDPKTTKEGIKNNRMVVNPNQREARMFCRFMSYIYNYDFLNFKKNRRRTPENQYIIENHMDDIVKISAKLSKMQELQFNGQYCDLFKMNGEIVTNEEFFLHMYRKLMKDFVFSSKSNNLNTAPAPAC